MLQRTEENECILVIQSTSIVCESLRMKKSQISIQMELQSVWREKVFIEYRFWVLIDSHGGCVMIPITTDNWNERNKICGTYKKHKERQTTFAKK